MPGHVIAERREFTDTEGRLVYHNRIVAGDTPPDLLAFVGSAAAQFPSLDEDGNEVTRSVVMEFPIPLPDDIKGKGFAAQLQYVFDAYDEAYQTKFDYLYDEQLKALAVKAKERRESKPKITKINNPIFAEVTVDEHGKETGGGSSIIVP